MLAALFFGLTYLTIPLGNIRITVASLAVIVCALLYGPVDAVIITALGEFLSQMLKYGFDSTTVLWIIPPCLRGLIVGILALISIRTLRPLEKRPVFLYITTICAAVFVTMGNTLVMYIDSVIKQYYKPGLIIADLSARLITGLVTAAIVTTLSVPVTMALKKAGFGSLREPKKES